MTTITRKGQVTIPVQLRKRLGLTAGSRVVFEYGANGGAELVVKPVRDFSSLRGSFVSDRKYSKKKARQSYLRDVLKGKI
ncbi:AbrB/MazE/SpoVT family DNA-binding domain-containing protein [Candidatus Parcubacteria bacterium]|nr:AbrB/MazE/SpoVT family DNA-binding domain-containing protein [Candidatus Parcubacteria bacterium]